jgi:circadian clock protein KaiB
MRRGTQLSKRSTKLSGGSSDALGGQPFKLSSRVDTYRFRLYIAGNDKKSRQAIESLQRLSHLFVPGRFSAEIIDLYENAEMAKKDCVLAVPALVKIHPPPPATFIGATNDQFAILRRLGIPFDPSVMTAYPRNPAQS